MTGGRDRLKIGTYGDIRTSRTSAGTVQAHARYRDWDGEVRKVTATAGNARAAKQALRTKLGRRAKASGFGAEFSSESTVEELSEAWLEEIRNRSDLADGTKDLYRRELNSLVLPTFKNLRLYEVTVGRVDHFLKHQALVSDAYARHSRSVLKLLFDFALRRDAVRSNPVAGTARLIVPKDKKPKALSLDDLDKVRHAVATWRTGKGVMGPKPDGQVRDVIEVLLGTSDRIGEALALRKCDIDDNGRHQGRPMRVRVAGTVVVITGKGAYRQDHPKTSNSRRVLEVPGFTAEVIRRRLDRIEGEDDDHLLFFTRNGTPLSPHNVRRTLRSMLKAAGLSDLDVTPHSFRRTAGTVIARATDSETAAGVMGNTPEVAEKHYIEPQQQAPQSAPATHLEVLAPRSSSMRFADGDQREGAA